jgi:hypothetical protein
MGEAPPPEREHILCLLPLKEDSSILESIKKKHPNVDFTYREATYEKGKPFDTHIPDGK